MDDAHDVPFGGWVAGRRRERDAWLPALPALLAHFLAPPFSIPMALLAAAGGDWLLGCGMLLGSAARTSIGFGASASSAACLSLALALVAQAQASLAQTSELIALFSLLSFAHAVPAPLLRARRPSCCAMHASGVAGFA